MFFKRLTSSHIEQRTSILHFGKNSLISSIHGTTMALLFVVPLGCQSLGGDLNKNSSVLSKGHTILKEHVIMFDEDGYPLDPTGNYACIEKTDTTEFSYCEGKHHFLLNYPRFTRQDFNWRSKPYCFRQRTGKSQRTRYHQIIIFCPWRVKYPGWLHRSHHRRRTGFLQTYPIPL